MNTFWRNVPLLAIGQALMLSSMTLILTVSALVGVSLAPDKSLATLPIAVVFIAVMMTSIPAALLMERIGRKAGFMMATFFGMGGGLVAIVSIVNENFWLFVFSGFLVGIFNGFGNYFRFTAADSVDHDHKSRAISYVLLGGVVAAVVGPNLGIMTRNAITDLPFAGSYLSVTGLFIIMFCVLAFLKLPRPTRPMIGESKDSGRHLRHIMQQPKFIVAMLCATLGYATMSFVMTATPLAMNGHAHSLSDTSFVIQWHVLGMFAPSFITGYLILRFGVLKIMFTGGLLGLLCVSTNLLGHSVWHYWLALTLLGVSWNFLYVGGTTLLTETYTVAEKGKAQGVNDFTIFTIVTIASLTSGVLLHNFGWQIVNIGVIPLLLLILISITWLALKQRRDEQVPEQFVQEAIQNQEL
jgi:MFS family permease